MNKYFTTTLATVMAVSAVLSPSFYSSIARADELSGPQISQEDSDSKLERLLESLKFKARGYFKLWRPEVTASHQPGQVTRFDRLRIPLNVSLSPELGNSDLTQKAGLKTDGDLTFQYARQFANQKEAMNAPNYGFAQNPLSSQRALTNFKEGDYFSMRANMNLVLKGSVIKGIDSSIPVEAEAHYSVGGEFQFHALRLDSQRLQIRLISAQKDEKGASIKVSAHPGLEILKVGYLNRKVNRLLETTPLRISWDKLKNQMFTVDYVVNLADPETAAEYDKVLMNAKDVKELAKILNPKQDGAELVERMTMDIEPLDSLFRRTQGADGKVVRTFKGTLDQTSKVKQIGLDFKLMKGESKETCSSNKVASVQTDETSKHYVLESCLGSVQGEMLFNWFQIKTDSRMSAVYSANENFDQLSPDDIVLSVEMKNNRFRKMEFGQLQEKLAGLLPHQIAHVLDFSRWNQDRTSSVAMNYQLAINPDLIFQIPASSREQIEARYNEYLKQFSTQDLYGGLTGNRPSEASDEMMESRVKVAVQEISKVIVKVLNPSLSKAERMQNFLKLRKDALFNMNGVRFLIEMLPQANLEQNLYFEFKMRSSNGDQVTGRFGQRADNPIYSRLLKIQDLLNSDGLDMRLQSEALFARQKAMNQKP
jgi:hypothetical protein